MIGNDSPPQKISENSSDLQKAIFLVTLKVKIAFFGIKISPKLLEKLCPLTKAL